jgi:hypothetical protein
VKRMVMTGLGLVVIALVVAAAAPLAASASYIDYPGPYPKISTSISGVGVFKVWQSGKLITTVRCGSDFWENVVTNSYSSYAHEWLYGCVGYGGPIETEAICTSPGSTSGEIASGTLHEILGVTSSEVAEPAIAHLPFGKSTSFAEFTCGEAKIKFTGGVISKIGPVNTLAESFTETASAVEEVQEITSLQGHGAVSLKASINGGEPLVTTLESEEHDEFAAPTEIQLSSGPGFKPFEQCPLADPAVETCVFAVSEEGSQLTVGGTAVPLTKSIALQGGVAGAEFVAPASGETLSAESQTIPGGLEAVVEPSLLPEALRATYEEDRHKRVTATIELAGPASSIDLDIEDLLDGEGSALVLPVKIKLRGPLLGSTCYVGSDAAPVVAHLTTGTSGALVGKAGEAVTSEEGNVLTITNSSLVDDSFAAPEAEGCGEADAAVNAKIGLPSASGENSVVIDGVVHVASAEYLR